LQLLSHLSSFKVTRDRDEPKEVEFTFTFTPNEYLDNSSLTLKKMFSNVQAPDPESQITSTKVHIQWKHGKDLTQPVEGVSPSFFTWFAFEGPDKDEADFPDSADIAVELAYEIYPHAHKIYQEAIGGESDEAMEEDLEDDGTIFQTSCHWHVLQGEDDEDSEDSDDSDEPPAKKKKHSRH
jgi:hypothetical protein